VKSGGIARTFFFLPNLSKAEKSPFIISSYESILSFEPLAK